MPSVCIPRKLHLLNQWIPENSGITKRMIVENHTMYPYLSVFYSPEMIARMDKYIDADAPDYDFEYMQIQKARRIRKDFLCFCPECVAEDEMLYGEAYWHRLHQIQGVLYCPKHRVKLENSRVEMERTSYHFRPASGFAVKSENWGTDSVGESYKEQYIKIAGDIEWLLNNGLTLGGAETIGIKYKDMYMGKGGIATVNGSVFRARFATEINAFYGKAFLDQVLSIGGYVKNWDSYAVASNSEHMRPLHQLLIINFLCGSPEAFRDSIYKRIPYGSPPWPCINKHCSHFGVDGIEEIEYKFDYHFHVGYFRCKYCGMTYRRRHPDQSFEEYSKWAVITDYGHLWESKLRECIFERKMIQKEILKEMQISANKLKSLANEWGLDVNANAKGIPTINPGDLYKKQVLLLLEKQPEISSNDVRELVSDAAYVWFHKNDFQWLQNLLTPEKEKVHWKEKDERLTSLFQSVYTDLQQNGDTRRRVTISYLCTLAGIIGSMEQQRIKNQLNLLPNLKHFMDSVLETEDKWIARRVTEIHLRYKKAGRKLRINHVRKDIHVRTKKFNFYKESILALMDELDKADRQ